MQKAFEKRSLLSCSWSTQEQPWSPLKARSEDVVTVMTGQCSKRTFFFLVRYIPWSCHERQDLEYREHQETVGIAFWCAGYDVCVVRLWPGIYPEFRFRWGADTKLSVEGLSIWMKFRRGGETSWWGVRGLYKFLTRANDTKLTCGHHNIVNADRIYYTKEFQYTRVSKQS